MATKKKGFDDLRKALEIRLTPYIPHVPTPNQHAFLWLTCKEAFFGGAAGGGKSDALLMAALQYVDIPGYAAILFRKTYADLKLPGSLIPRSHEWLAQSDARWNDNDKQWVFPSGASLNFGYMQTDEDRYRYQSSEFQFVGYDEATHFSEMQYVYMVSRLRRPSTLGTNHPLAKVPLRLRAASNPGGRGHLWVKNRFILKKDPPKDPTQRVFIPSKLTDNPHIDQETYMEGLMMMDEGQRAQLLEGDWDAREPGEWMIPDPSWIDAAEALGDELWRVGPPEPVNGMVDLCLDWGEYTQGYIIWELPHGGIFIPPSEVRGEHEEPVEVGLRLLATARRLRLRVRSARYDAAGIQSMRSFMATARRQPGYERMKSVKIPFNKYKREAILYERFILRRTALGKTNRIMAIHPDNVELLRQLRAWRRKDDESEVAEKVDDHGPDAVVAGIAPVAARHRDYINLMLQKAKEAKKEKE